MNAPNLSENNIPSNSEVQSNIDLKKYKSLLNLTLEYAYWEERVQFFESRHMQGLLNKFQAIENPNQRAEYLLKIIKYMIQNDQSINNKITLLNLIKLLINTKDLSTEVYKELYIFLHSFIIKLNSSIAYLSNNYVISPNLSYQLYLANILCYQAFLDYHSATNTIVDANDIQTILEHINKIRQKKPLLQAFTRYIFTLKHPEIPFSSQGNYPEKLATLTSEIEETLKKPQGINTITQQINNLTKEKIELNYSKEVYRKSVQQNQRQQGDIIETPNVEASSSHYPLGTDSELESRVEYQAPPNYFTSHENRDRSSNVIQSTPEQIFNQPKQSLPPSGSAPKQ